MVLSEDFEAKTDRFYRLQNREKLCKNWCSQVVMTSTTLGRWDWKTMSIMKKGGPCVPQCTMPNGDAKQMNTETDPTWTSRSQIW